MKLGFRTYEQGGFGLVGTTHGSGFGLGNNYVQDQT
jgi:hypothetical protein